MEHDDFKMYAEIEFRIKCNIQILKTAFKLKLKHLKISDSHVHFPFIGLLFQLLLWYLHKLKLRIKVSTKFKLAKWM